MVFFNWIFCQQDRASNNKACVNKIEENFLFANPTKDLCYCHIFNNAGKKALGKEDIIEFTERFRKIVQIIVNNPGKAKDYFIKRFGEHINSSSRVRYLVKTKHGPEFIINKILLWFIEKMYLNFLLRNG